jgi:ribosome-associated protein YbcJ (S4-like RNA binding protein)
MVADGLVILNGETEYRKTAKIRAGDTVRCEETEIIVEAAT